MCKDNYKQYLNLLYDGGNYETDSNTKIFDQASGASILTGVPIAYSNSSLYGGSCFYLKLPHLEHGDEFYRSHPLDRFFEGIHIMNIDTKHQFDTKPSFLESLNRTKSEIRIGRTRNNTTILEHDSNDSNINSMNRMLLESYPFTLPFYQDRLIRTIRLLNTLRGCSTIEDDARISKIVQILKEMVKNLFGTLDFIEDTHIGTHISIIQNFKAMSYDRIFDECLNQMYNEDLVARLNEKETIRPEAAIKNIINNLIPGD